MNDTQIRCHFDTVDRNKYRSSTRLSLSQTLSSSDVHTNHIIVEWKEHEVEGIKTATNKDINKLLSDGRTTKF